MSTFTSMCFIYQYLSIITNKILSFLIMTLIQMRDIG